MAPALRELRSKLSLNNSEATTPSAVCVMYVPPPARVSSRSDVACPSQPPADALKCAGPNEMGRVRVQLREAQLFSPLQVESVARSYRFSARKTQAGPPPGLPASLPGQPFQSFLRPAARVVLPKKKKSHLNSHFCGQNLPWLPTVPRVGPNSLSGIQSLHTWSHKPSLPHPRLERAPQEPQALLLPPPAQG